MSWSTRRRPDARVARAWPTPPDDATPGSYWDCADILTGRAVLSTQPGAVQHTAMKSFTFWEIKSEIQPSAHGMTTRPAPEPLPMTVCYKD